MRIAVIADDLTGALDTGVQFTQWGYTTQLTNDPENSTAQVTITNTDTRNKTPKQAYQTIHNLTKQLTHTIIYKKLDSTLRGNPGPETQAILDATGETHAILTPTYPPTGRRVLNGHLYIHDNPITETEYINEHRHHTSYIPEILETQAHVTKNPETIKPGINVIDATTEQDLTEITRHHTRILAGSAGLADALCQTLRNPPPVITIIGTMRTQTRTQTQQLQTRLGATIIPLDTTKALNKTPQYETIHEAEIALKTGQDTVITSTPSQETIEHTKTKAQNMGLTTEELEKRVTQALAQVTETLLKHKTSGLILTGGATALAVTQRLGIKNIEILDEVEPGIPVLRLDQTLAVTKAGGFGQPDTLIRATKYLKRKNR
ncbi:MAG: hypothetical protein NWF07_14710 [Candidatus Bathyarchaeota archaeon]|nr:hypothetical protein [Candidatus Bathyarchaeota archaeon]